MMYGSEFVVEMRAGERVRKGDLVCTLEYIDGSCIDDEAAYRAKDHPEGFVVGTCWRGVDKGKMVTVEFDSDKISNRASVLLFALKKKMFLRWLAETYPSPGASKRQALEDAIDALPELQ